MEIVTGLEEPTSGRIIFAGQDITNLTGKEMRQIRKNMQIVFQDSNASMNPMQTVCGYIEEPLNDFQVGTKKERRLRVLHWNGDILDTHEAVLGFASSKPSIPIRRIY